MVEYKLCLGRGHVVSLEKLARFGAANIAKHLGLTTNQITNFARMKHWGLVEPMANEDGTHRWGWWAITGTGREFLAKRQSIPKYIWTFRDVAQRAEGPYVMVDALLPGYKQHPEYAQEAKPHGGTDERQTALF